MTKKEILFTSIVALIIGIILVHYEDFLETLNGNGSQPPGQTIAPLPEAEENQPNSIITQLKELVIPEAAVTVTFWLDAPDKIQFTTQDRVTLYYQIEEGALANGNNREFYFTLFNIWLAWLPLRQRGVSPRQA